LAQIALDTALPTILTLKELGSIASSLQVVERLRTQRQQHAELAQRTHAVRHWQAARFARTYVDVLQDAHMGPAARFFLTELYSAEEFSRRDAQFARIAGALERLFPQAVVSTATLLAQLHALSETLDACMARAWLQAQPEALQASPAQALDEPRYKSLWESLLAVPGYAAARQQQLDATRDLGAQLQRHTQIPGLRLMLKMMRGPASAAGLQDLQRFLERGFDTFAQLGRAGKVPVFLETVRQRETAWLARMAA
jgi:hypothetical protein